MLLAIWLIRLTNLLLTELMFRGSEITALAFMKKFYFFRATWITFSFNKIHCLNTSLAINLVKTLDSVFFVVIKFVSFKCSVFIVLSYSIEKKKDFYACIAVSGFDLLSRFYTAIDHFLWLNLTLLFRRISTWLAIPIQCWTDFAISRICLLAAWSFVSAWIVRLYRLSISDEVVFHI